MKYMSKKKVFTAPIRCSAPANISLGSFLKDYDRGTVKIPLHQENRARKGGIWSEKKINNWIDLVIRTASDPSTTTSEKIIGHMIVTYRIEGDAPGSPKYINDGAHRSIHSIKKYIEKILPDKKSNNYKKQLKKYDQFIEYLDQVQITEQYKVYRDLKAAVDDFINLNTAGATGTAYEVLSAQFTCDVDEKRSHQFKDFLERVESSVPSKLINLGHPANKVGQIVEEDEVPDRRRKQKFIRDTRASFVSFATCNKLQCPYQGVSRIFLTEGIGGTKKSHINIESDLVKFFNESSPEDIKKKISEWERFLDNIIAVYKQVSEEFGLYVKRGETSIRWWIFMCVYWKNTNASINHRTFLEAWFNLYQGETSFFYKKQEEDKIVNKKTTAQLQKFKSDVYDAFGLDRNEIEKEKKRKKSKIKPQVGFHNSHLKNFSEHGEGDTLMENALENLKRGDRDMKQDEIDRLKRSNKISTI